MLARAACPTWEGTENEPLAIDTEVYLPDASPTTRLRLKATVHLLSRGGGCHWLSTEALAKPHFPGLKPESEEERTGIKV